MFDILLSYISRSTFITIFVLSWLSIYFILTFSILISKMIYLSSWIYRENKALESLLLGSKNINIPSILRKCIKGNITKEKLDVCISMSEKNATSGLTWLSIIASTSPFIGLFGTVVSILDTFANMGSGNAGLSVIAPAISEALVATGAGIFVAIPAYTFHLLIKRKAYEVINIIKRSADVILFNNKDQI
ncbi:MotA/TolQ/ExbB proton channel family protein [Campylobacter blaseri]|uniref:Flagellar motor protein MotA n=1 Tax=Campylobacter blaseri TaxID=2042961 RepID=A0A2P8QZI2_9BACT|nr:flagellar motor protein MotA [Campylobacter blaseri]PSM53448.1 flagellar motor protein MotA [Campylobacter blaseri]